MKFKKYRSANIVDYKSIKNVLWLSVTLILITLTFSCKKLVLVNPPTTALSAGSVYNNNTTSCAVLTGIYDRMIEGGNISSGPSGISLLSGLSADELTNYSNIAPFPQFYANSLSSTATSSAGNTLFWQDYYQYIYTANSAIEGLSSSSGVTSNVKNQLLGEAKFVRAFCYFYLTNLYGDVPLLTTSNYQENDVAARTKQNLVYQQIIADLKSASNLLSQNYVASDATTVTTERTRPTKWAADALLARVYLYTGDWADSKTEADSVINNTSTFSLVSDLNGVFLANSSEAIWQLQPVDPNLDTWDAFVFILTSGPNQFQNPVSLSPQLLSSFETGDDRYSDWVGVDSSTGTTYYYPYKYKIGYGATSLAEYLMVIRLAELYLTRAEDEANGAGGGIQAALSDLNVIRNRAGLPNYAGLTDKASVVKAILHEKRIEFFTEWGHRWLDLKRSGTANAVMSIVTPQKGGTWNADWQLYPIPLLDIQNDSHLTQNPGYQ